MMSLGGTDLPRPRSFRSFAGTLLLAALWGAAGGAVEASVRTALNPLLYDSRLDAAHFVFLGAGAGALWGLSLGVLPAFLAPVPGGWVASLWPLAVLALSAPASRMIERQAAPFTAVCLGLAAGLLAATALMLLAGRVAARSGRRAGPARPGGLRPALSAAAILLAALGFFAARPFFGSPDPPSGAPSVLLITVDTLRADAVGAFREGRPHPAPLDRALTPRLDAEAGGGVLFTDASTTLPKTPEALASLMTGRYPGAHGLRNLFSTLSASNRTLAEILRDHGWRTRAAVTNLLVGRWSGLSQGFDRFRGKDGLRPQAKSLAAAELLSRLFPSLSERLLNRFAYLKSGHEDATETTDRAIEMLRSLGGRPWFLWVHYLDPHWPYWPPEPWRSRADTRPGAPFTLYDDVAARKILISDLIFRNPLPPEEVARAISLYAGEVSYTDHEIGRLLDAARALPTGASTIVVLTADHGEGLGEHRFHFSHGDEVYESSLRVPLIIRAPGGEEGRRVPVPVSLVDLFPTILEAAGVPIPAQIQGRSLAGFLAGDAGSTRPAEPATNAVFAESDLAYLTGNPFITIPGEAGKLRSIRAGPYKLICFPRDVEAARRIDPGMGAANTGLTNPLGLPEATRLGPSSPDIFEMYDLSSDPGETKDLYASLPLLAAPMRKALQERTASPAGVAGAPLEPTEELLKGLQSLGYVDPGGEKH